MSDAVQEQWRRKSRILTQALIFSVSINIGLLATFVHWILKEKKERLSFQMQPVSRARAHSSNHLLLRDFVTLSRGELVDLLQDEESVEDGYNKRDLALATLVKFHFFPIEKALSGFPLQKRRIFFQRKQGPEEIDMVLFPGMEKDQFQAIQHFLKTEKFPYTTKGLFFEIQRSNIPRDRSLLETFYLTSEWTTVETLFRRNQISLPQEYLIELISQGNWDLLDQFSQEQKHSQDLSPDRLKTFLHRYILHRSTLAAKVLLQWDRGYILKQFTDQDAIFFLDLFIESSPSLIQLLEDFLKSPRSDIVRNKVQEKFHTFARCTLPESYHCESTPEVSGRLVHDKKPAPCAAQSPIHCVAPGDTLWGISRKYRLSVEKIKQLNHLQKDQLRVGMQLIVTADPPHLDSKDGIEINGKRP